jgi:phosphate transport system substrate-binding protein
MNLLKKLSFAGLALALTIAPVFAGRRSKITVTGSTTVLPIAQKAAEDFMKANNGTRISVRGGGSGVGIAAMVDGRTDIANASRAAKTKEIKAARERGINPIEHVVAKDGLAIVVNPNNPVKEITIDQIKAIYTGEIDNWSDLGGPNKPIVVVSRDVSSGTYEVFKKLCLKGAAEKSGSLMLASNQAVAQTVAQTPDAIGYVGLGYLNNKVKALVVENKIASVENVQAGNYPIARNLYMYTNGKPKGKVKAYLDFIMSNEGQKIVGELGFVPVK